MGWIAKRALYALTVVVFLLPACAAAPAPTQDPTLSQQLIDQSVAQTMEAEHARATERQALLPTPTATLIPGPVGELPDVPASPTQASGPVGELPDLPTVPPTPLPTFTPTAIIEYDIYCKPYSGSTQTPQSESMLKAGTTVFIQNRVNLRTQPSRLNRIVMVLKPGTEVKIIGGPVETFYTDGKYVWWNIEIPGGLQGWSAELSLCGRYYFIGPASPTPTLGGS